jgi:hypothetical protein
MHVFALGLPHGSEWLIVIVYFAIVIAVPIFVICLLWRVTVALEHISRHLLEIARDVKRLSPLSSDEEE